MRGNVIDYKLTNNHIIITLIHCFNRIQLFGFFTFPKKNTFRPLRDLHQLAREINLINVFVDNMDRRENGYFYYFRENDCDELISNETNGRRKLFLQ